jgi:hypothetical protein
MPADSSITKVRMAELGISLTQLGVYAGVGLQKLSPWIGGVRPLDSESITKVNDAIKDLIRLQEIAAPWPIDFRRVVDIKHLLQQMRNGEFEALIESSSQAR